MLDRIVCKFVPFRKISLHMGVEILDAITAHEEGRVCAALFQTIEQPHGQSG